MTVFNKSSVPDYLQKSIVRVHRGINTGFLEVKTFKSSEAFNDFLGNPGYRIYFVCATVIDAIDTIDGFVCVCEKLGRDLKK